MNLKIWKGVAPFKVSFWVGDMFKEDLDDRQLRVRQILIVNACPLSMVDEETMNHLLLRCRFAYQIWCHFFQLLGMVFCLSKAWSGLFNEEVLLVGSSFKRTLWATTVLSIVWSMWLEKNSRIFSGNEFSVRHLIVVIKNRVAWWLVRSGEFRGITISNICRGWESVDHFFLHSVSLRSDAWSPPEMVLLKLNFDGSCVHELVLAGDRGIIRNGSGGTLLSFAEPLPNGSVLDVELYALWRVVMVLDELGVVGSISEDETVIVVGWASVSVCPWSCLDKVDKICHSIEAYGFSVSLVPRSANSEGMSWLVRV